MQNSLMSRYRHNVTYRNLIDEVRNVIGRACPVRRPTRWIHDFEILKFIQHPRGKIALALDEDDIPLEAEFMVLTA
jgi:hypothetical protein